MSEEVGTGSQNHMTYGQDFCKLAVFGCQGRSLLGCFEIWTLMANFAVPSEGPRQVGYKKYFILPGLFCPGE